MNLSPCLHPKIVRNRFTGEKMMVPCGHCEQCQNLRSFMWSQKIEDEMKLHKYSIFFTLTYDENNVPLLVKSSRYRLVSLFRERFHLLSDGKRVSFPIDDDISIDLKPLYALATEFESKYYRSRKYFPYVRLADVRNFYKRLRSKIDYYCPYGEEKQIFHFTVSELGENTYRSHYHGILFTDSSWVAQNFGFLMDTCWLFGYTDYSHVSRPDRCASYVAKYVVKPADLPQIYRDPQISPFYSFSRSISFGTGLFTDSEVFEILTNASPTIAKYSRKEQSFVDVPLYKSLENRIFPRIRRFDFLTPSARIVLYGLWKELCFPHFREFVARISYLVTRSVKPFECRQSFRDSILSLQYNFSNEVMQFFRECYSCDLQNYSRGDDSFNCLKSFYYCSRKVCLWCLNHGYSLSHYVSLIDRYYANKNAYKLKNQLEFEESYSAEHDPNDLVWLFPVVVDDLNNDVTIPLESFDYFFHHETFDFHPLEQTFDWKITSLNSEELMKKKNAKSVVRGSFDYAQFKTTISHFEIIE